MPGEAWPWKYTRSPGWSPMRARKKWFMPTSISVAEEAKVEMCPPMPSSYLLARTTIATAFHRTRLLMRRSSSLSPGYAICSSTGIVLTYGVFMPSTAGAPCFVAAMARRSSR
jgi:hypothetical protein